MSTNDSVSYYDSTGDRGEIEGESEFRGAGGGKQANERSNLNVHGLVQKIMIRLWEVGPGLDNDRIRGGIQTAEAGPRALSKLQGR